MGKLDRKMKLKSKTNAAGLYSISLSSSSSWILVILGLTAALIGQGHAVDVTVETTSARVHVGDNVTVLCRVDPASYGDAVNFLKVIVGPDRTEHEETISINDIITPLYLGTGRYSATVFPTGEALLFLLYINNFQPEDSGAFVCRHLQSSGKQGTSVEVYMQPEKIWFEDYEDGDTIHFEEEQGLPISCIATRSSPPPKMSIRLGSKDLIESFTSDGTMHVRCNSPEAADKACLLTADYDASLTTDSFVPFYEYDEGSLKCSADIGEDSGFEPMETSLKLDVAYAPKIIEESCLPVYNVQEGENLLIQCTVRFNPEPEDGGVFWFATSTSTGKNYTLEPLQTNHELGFRAGKQVVDHKVWLVTLTIDWALQKHSTNFDLIVVNRLGRVQHPIRVNVEKTEQAGSVVGGLAVTVSINGILLLAASILARVSHDLW